MDLAHTKVTGVTLHHFDYYSDKLQHKREHYWQHRDSDKRQVGPQYPTRAEALADTNNYVRRAGWL